MWTNTLVILSSSTIFHVFIFICISALLVYMYVHHVCTVPAEARRGRQSSRTRVTDDCKPLCPHLSNTHSILSLWRQTSIINSDAVDHGLPLKPFIFMKIDIFGVFFLSCVSMVNLFQIPLLLPSGFFESFFFVFDVLWFEYDVVWWPSPLFSVCLVCYSLSFLDLWCVIL